MPRLVWDNIGEKLYETGIKNGVLYPVTDAGTYPKGVAWNGLTGVEENPSGAEANKIYADDINYLNLYSAEEFGCTIKAYTYPEEFEACDGSKELTDGVIIGQQARQGFGFAYKTTVGNDTLGDEYGYKLHVVYGCKASPSSKGYNTINDSPEAIEFSWEVTTTPVTVKNHKPSATLVIDSKKVASSAKLKAIEDVLFGVEAPDFSAEKTYAVGDCVTYEETVYKCITAVTTPGAWDDSKWEEVENPDARLPLPDKILEIIGK